MMRVARADGRAETAGRLMAVAPSVRRACACGKGGGGTCMSCAEKKRTLRRQTAGAGPALAPAIVHDALRRPGAPLDRSVRAMLEPAFGQDLSGIRVHTDDAAGRSAAAVEAQAYTVGQHMVFAAGRYAPSTAAGRRLIAHEAAHAVQQGPLSGPPPAALPVGPAADAAEREADHAADAALAGGAAPALLTSSAPAVRRDPVPGTAPAQPAPAPGIGTVVLDGFTFNVAALTSAHKKTLDGLAKRLTELLAANPGSSVMITGHTDAVGDEAVNNALGQQRADAVRDRLASGGVDGARMTTASAGKSRLRVATDRSEPANRRAEVQFVPAPAAQPAAPGSGGASPPAVPGPLLPLAKPPVAPTTPNLLGPFPAPYKDPTLNVIACMKLGKSREACEREEEMKRNRGPDPLDENDPTSPFFKDPQQRAREEEEKKKIKERIIVLPPIRF